jgi:hypothetical protein
MSEVAAITESMLAAMDGYIARAVAPFKAQIAALEKRIEALPAPEKGEPGKDAPPVDVDALVSRVNEIVMRDIDEAIIVHANSAVARFPVPKDGEPGKDADPEEVSNVVAETIRSAILPEMIEKAIAALPKAKDGNPGKDADPAVSVTFGSINADGHLLLGMSDGKFIDVGMVKGEPGKDGDPGSVALGDHTVWGLDATRSYPKGTWAIHAGALLHAKRATGPIADGLETAGWEAAFEVPQDWSMELGDDMRTFTARAVTASGVRLTLVKKIPVILDQGTWQPKLYGKGDAVTHDSSLWIARRDTSARPGESDDWRLSARKGRDGRNADGSRATAERGPVRLK